MVDNWHSFFDGKFEPDLNSGCWLWNKQLSDQGYGRVKIGGRPVRAHRLSLELATGFSLGDAHALHKCDVRACVNPDHLYAGSAGENAHDRMNRDRGHRWNGERRGGNNPLAKLDEQRVSEIRRALTKGASRQFLADKYGVSVSTILTIDRGLSWIHVVA